MAFLVWLDAAFDCTTAESDHNAIRPRTDEKMTSEIHPHWDADPCTVIAEIFVRDLISYISYFLGKVRNLVAYKNHARIQVYLTPPSLYENF